MKIHSPIITGSFIDNLNGGTFSILNGSSPLVTVTPAGNLGLGLTTPSYKLHVSGNMSAHTYFGDGSNLTGIGSIPFPYTGSATVSGSFTISGSLSVSGSIFATDKSFEIPHPTQPGKKLVYGVLEGPEHAVYCRGKVDDEIIELPEEWVGLVDESSITVQLTPIGKYHVVWVDEISNNKIKLASEDLINCYYFVQGTRKDIDKLQTVREA